MYKGKHQESYLYRMYKNNSQLRDASQLRYTKYFINVGFDSLVTHIITLAVVLFCGSKSYKQWFVADFELLKLETAL